MRAFSHSSGSRTSSSSRSSPAARRAASACARDFAERRARRLGGHAAEALVVDQLGDRRRRAAHRTRGVLLHAELVELHAQRFVLEQAPVERLAHARDDLHRLGGLDQRDEARQHAEHAALGARGHRARRRRLRVEAAVAGAVARIEHGRLAVEAEDRAVHVGPAEQHARVVGEIARGEVVGAVDDHVVLARTARARSRTRAARVALDEHVGVHRGDPLRGHVDLRPPTSAVP